MKKETWSKGKALGTVITDDANGLFESTGHAGASAIEYYGGALVCESVHRSKDVALISAAPDMLEALESLENNNGYIPELTWTKIKHAIKKAKNE